MKVCSFSGNTRTLTLAQGKRSWGKDRTILLCSCSICHEKTTEDPTSKESIRGTYLGRNEFYEHQRADRARAADAIGASSSLAPHPSSVTLPDSSHSGADTSPRIAVTQTVKEEVPRPEASTVKHSDDQDLAYIQELSDALSRRKSQLQDEHHGLVFVQTPHVFSQPSSVLLASGQQKRELNAGFLELVYNDSHNTALLEYERWLVESYVQLETRTKSKSSKIAFSAVFVCYDFAEAITEVERWKMAEWDGQREEAQEDLKRPTVSQSGDRATVDTRKLPPFRRLCSGD